MKEHCTRCGCTHLRNERDKATGEVSDWHCSPVREDGLREVSAFHEARSAHKGRRSGTWKDHPRKTGPKFF